MPVLEDDGVEYYQSITIARYLANKFNLAGATPHEKAQADMVVDCVADFFNGKILIYFLANFSWQKTMECESTVALSNVPF